MRSVDVAIIGGGLAGLVAAHRAAAGYLRVALVDRSFADGKQLGGFAAFSGAKFSFYPAGRGLEVTAGGPGALIDAYEIVADFLGQHSAVLASRSIAIGSEVPQGDAKVREYHSLLLTPEEIQRLIAGLSQLPDNVQLFQSAATQISGEEGCFLVHGDGWSLSASKVIVAAGRTGSGLLQSAGCVPQEGKGLDVGIRLEFSDLNQVAALRKLGADAKILLDGTRTFCLNSPGRIYHYPAGSLSIPGGIVANDGVRAANFGILHRCAAKTILLADITQRARRITGLSQPVPAAGPMLQDPDIAALFGEDTASAIERLQIHLYDLGLVDFDSGYLIHRPLLDWHWPVYGVGQGFETSVPGIFCVGDASGAARGLLQAATSGWLCVERLER